VRVALLIRSWRQVPQLADSLRVKPNRQVGKLAATKKARFGEGFSPVPHMVLG
jgi:hypothetical protein